MPRLLVAVRAEMLGAGARLYGGGAAPDADVGLGLLGGRLKLRLGVLWLEFDSPVRVELSGLYQVAFPRLQIVRVVPRPLQRVETVRLIVIAAWVVEQLPIVRIVSPRSPPRSGLV
jgi:hypothetical protein